MTSDNIWLNQAPWLMSGRGGPNGAGGGTPPDSAAITAGRDALDNLRMHPNQQQRNGAAEYPAGYLSTITGRGVDRLGSGVLGRLDDRSYQRGIHKGTKMDPQQYFWPEEFTPDMGVRRPAHLDPDTFLLEQRRQAPVPINTERLMHTGLRAPVGNPDPVSQPYMDHLQTLMPEWQ
jgi:hypothetical protein